MSAQDLPTRFLTFVREEQLFNPTDRLLLAVSGGLDSTVLAHLLHAGGYTFALAHCNFGLRGVESDADAAFVARLARGMNVPLHTTRIHIDKESESVQVAARDRRYMYFKKILDEYNYDLLVTAHHLDDSLETLLLNLVRGTGLRGLRGIPPRTDFPLARPLLAASRAEIAAYAEAQGISWREDASNAGNDYRRNALRHRVVPVLRELGLTDPALRATLGHLRSAAHLLRTGAERVPGFERMGDTVRWDRRDASPTPADAHTVLRELTYGMGFTEEQLRQVVHISGRARIESDTHVAYVSPLLVHIAPRTAPPPAVAIPNLPRQLTTPAGQLYLDVVDRPATLEAPDTEYCRFPGTPLTLRYRGVGDQFQPLGMQGKRKRLSRYFIDAKVPPWERDRVPLLCDREGGIIAVLGHRIAQPYAVGNEQRVLRIRLTTESPDPS